jgi:protein SCO1
MCHSSNLQSTRGRLPRFLFAALACLAASTSLSWAPVARAEDKQPKWDPAGLEDFSLTECHGQTVTKADLLGKPWVACFIFTRCAGPCPRVSEQMQILQDRLKGLDVRLVSLTVDPERDTPEELRKYAEYYKADPARWWFLTGDKEKIFHLIERGFRMIVEDDALQIPGFEVKHSTTIMLVDAGGVVRGKYNALNDVDMARLRRAVLGKSDAADQAIITEGDANERRQAELQRLAEEAVKRKARDEEAAEARSHVPAWVLRLPAVNASLNGLATVLLVAGFMAIKSGRIPQHKRIMLTAFATSAIFLVCYLVYHAALAHYTGDGSRRFAGTGAIRFIYFAILISHVLLAVVVAVLAPTVVYRALKGQFERHKRLARLTFPIWLYVSVTGVIIYFILYHWPVGPV